jgi:hypothetical protein
METQEILSMENAAMERWRQGDPMGWAEISAEDITYVEPNLTGQYPVSMNMQNTWKTLKV